MNGKEQFKTSSLWSWKNNNSLVEALAHAQKGRGLLLARRKIVEQYLPLLEGPLPSCLFYVSKNNKKDHGYEWALAFAQILQRPMRALFIENQEDYKSKNRKQRSQSGRIQPIMDREKNFVEQSWFIDDIRTTGETARSAWQALGKPECFRTVVMVQRELC
ncbi:hypothetical protein K2X05_02665 [bacterium]|nr:hypothetical protein [bacterium]